MSGNQMEGVIEPRAAPKRLEVKRFLLHEGRIRVGHTESNVGVQVIVSRTKIDFVCTRGRAEMEPAVLVCNRCVVSRTTVNGYSHSGHVDAISFWSHPAFDNSERQRVRNGLDAANRFSRFRERTGIAATVNFETCIPPVSEKKIGAVFLKGETDVSIFRVYGKFGLCGFLEKLSSRVRDNTSHQHHGPYIDPI